MEKSIVTTGKTIDLAIEAALTQLGLDRDSVSVQVLAQAKAGFLGFGATPAKVQVTYEAPDPKPEAPRGAPINPRLPRSPRPPRLSLPRPNPSLLPPRPNPKRKHRRLNPRKKHPKLPRSLRYMPPPSPAAWKKKSKSS